MKQAKLNMILIAVSWVFVFIAFTNLFWSR